jgi:O-methyltransferase
MKRPPERPAPLREQRLRNWYVRWILPHLPRDLDRQRVKLLYFVWGYWPLLQLPALPLVDRLKLLARFVRIDWNVLHSHQPGEIASVCAVLAQRPARRGEVMVEAGCWNGGASAKFSLVCALRGYRLRIYDSFEGVEPMTSEEKQRGYDFSGEYVASDATLRANLQRFGAPDVCSIHKGWFAATLAGSPVADIVRVVFIDCDSAKGTQEVLLGVVPSLASDGVVFSQDFHIASVQELLLDRRTWERYGRGDPSIERLCGHLAMLRLPQRIERRVLADRRRAPARRVPGRRVAAG